MWSIGKIPATLGEWQLSQLHIFMDGYSNSFPAAEHQKFHLPCNSGVASSQFDHQPLTPCFSFFFFSITGVNYVHISQSGCEN